MATIVLSATVGGNTTMATATLADADAQRYLAAFKALPGNSNATLKTFLLYALNATIANTAVLVKLNEQAPPPTPPAVTIS